MSDENFYKTFQLEASSIRGRIVHLETVIDEILEAHNYPLPIAHLVGETATLAVALSSMLKYEGIFTLQAQGDGPLKMLVSDLASNGDVRACASFDSERFQNSREHLSALKTVEGDQNHLAQYLGKGYIAFTVDQGAHTDRYQGIVELNGASLVECVQHYFAQSEQIGTGIKMAIGERDGKWRSAAIMLQHMPEDQKNSEAGAGNVREDDWRRAMVLLDSCTDDELLSPDLTVEELLFRLFHEEGVRIYDPKPIQKNCRCDEERVKNVLYTLTPDDIDYVTVDGKITMTCEFCSKQYEFDRNAVEKMLTKMKENQNHDE